MTASAPRQRCASFWRCEYYRGGGGGPGGQAPPFWGLPNFIKRKKTLRTCGRISRVSVLNSYPDPYPFRNPVSTPTSVQSLLPTRSDERRVLGVGGIPFANIPLIGA